MPIFLSVSIGLCLCVLLAILTTRGMGYARLKKERNTVEQICREIEANLHHAWTSGDFMRWMPTLDRHMGKAEKHLFLQNLVERTHKRNNSSLDREICAYVSAKHISEFPKIVPELMNRSSVYEYGRPVLPKTLAFTVFPAFLIGEGRYDDAIDIYRLALSYPFSERDKRLYRNRIERTEAKKFARFMACERCEK